LGGLVEKVCAENPELSKTEVDDDFITGGADLILATIPPIELYIFRAEQRNEKQIKELWELIDKELALKGWERHKPDPNAEVKDPWIRIEHKYFHVQYRKI
jgi:hypothetical protein